MDIYDDMEGVIFAFEELALEEADLGQMGEFLDESMTKLSMHLQMLEKPPLGYVEPEAIKELKRTNSVWSAVLPACELSPLETVELCFLRVAECTLEMAPSRMSDFPADKLRAFQCVEDWELAKEKKLHEEVWTVLVFRTRKVVFTAVRDEKKLRARVAQLGMTSLAAHVCTFRTSVACPEGRVWSSDEFEEAHKILHGCRALVDLGWKSAYNREKFPGWMVYLESQKMKMIIFQNGSVCIVVVRSVVVALWCNAKLLKTISYQMYPADHCSSCVPQRQRARSAPSFCSC